jgi:AcrR family transcriptional regulator
MAKRAEQVSKDKTELRAPAQMRSRASMEALLDIGRRLIEERGIDDCSMSDVAEAAGSSIGSLYFRFGNRERFISEVMQRQIQSAREDFERLIAGLNVSAKAPDEVITSVTQWIVGVFGQNKGLLRAQLRRALENPQEWRPFQDFARYLVEEMIAVLERFTKLRVDPDWQLHVRIAMQFVFGTLNNILINRPGPLELDDRATAEELSKLAVRYLCLESTRETKRKGTS